jgi:hypothetical protein
VVEGLARLWVVSGAGVECQKNQYKATSNAFFIPAAHSGFIIPAKKKEIQIVGRLLTVSQLL